jgi:hypothetical protein
MPGYPQTREKHLSCPLVLLFASEPEADSLR